MSDAKEDNIVVGVINKLVERVETLDKTTSEHIASFEKTIIDRQAVFEKNMFDMFVALRQDIHKATIGLELDAKDHNNVHVAEKLERENDKLLRAQRQFTLNLILFGIAALVIIGIIISIVIQFINKG
jgi:hypothetical protein